MRLFTNLVQKFDIILNMAVTAIDLNLESEELVFYSGQRIKGALVVQISLPIIIAGKCGFHKKSSVNASTDKHV